MKDYSVVASIKAEQKGIIDDVFNKGYDQGYQDGKLDGEAENIEKLEKSLDAEKESEYQRGYEQGRRSTITIKDFEEYYRTGFKHGQELRAKEAECAEACGMRRAWNAARKLRHMDYSTLYKVFEGDDVVIHSIQVKGLEAVYEKYTASEVIAKLDAWEKKQEKQRQPDKVDCKNTDCKNCIDHPNCNEDEWKLRRRGIVPAPPKEKQTEKWQDL